MNCLHPISISVVRPSTGEVENLHVGCGKCPNCLRSKRFEWSMRIGAEIDKCKDAYFVTLTFNDENLPRGLDTGRRYWQCFMKRFRKNTGLKGFKYFCCSELGEEKGRLHFHCIFINLGRSASFLRKALERDWQGGFTDVQYIKNSKKCAEYVSKYCYQDMDRPSCFYVDYKIDENRIFKVRVQTPKYFRRYVSKGMGLSLLSDAFLAYLRQRGDGTFVDPRFGELSLPSYYIGKVWPPDSEEYLFIKASRLEKLLDNQSIEEHEIEQWSKENPDNPHESFTRRERDANKVRKTCEKQFRYFIPPTVKGEVERLFNSLEFGDVLFYDKYGFFSRRPCRRCNTNLFISTNL